MTPRRRADGADVRRIDPEPIRMLAEEANGLLEVAERSRERCLRRRPVVDGERGESQTRQIGGEPRRILLLPSTHLPPGITSTAGCGPGPDGR